MAFARCPLCDDILSIAENLGLDHLLTCPTCFSNLKIVSTDPFELEEVRRPSPAPARPAYHRPNEPQNSPRRSNDTSRSSGRAADDPRPDQRANDPSRPAWQNETRANPGRSANEPARNGANDHRQVDRSHNPSADPTRTNPRPPTHGPEAARRSYPPRPNPSPPFGEQRSSSSERAPYRPAQSGGERQRPSGSSYNPPRDYSNLLTQFPPNPDKLVNGKRAQKWEKPKEDEIEEEFEDFDDEELENKFMRRSGKGKKK